MEIKEGFQSFPTILLFIEKIRNIKVKEIYLKARVNMAETGVEPMRVALFIEQFKIGCVPEGC